MTSAAGSGRRALRALLSALLLFALGAASILLWKRSSRGLETPPAPPAAQAPLPEPISAGRRPLPEPHAAPRPAAGDDPDASWIELNNQATRLRSEERRVGKEWRSRCARAQ